ncbi:hypothetical protein GOBAR_AA21288 [Gossypium barbadense]|uniref:Zinc knuckle CX2CX4HX4C domain-containing protein n=1 Tax=Gossypium barbadense TaxID=3634 RepID=A0A2P5X7S4_GOSBA|nr:hypothetical protein GOBAR_AA21288 [Gossypium barbadense]
MEEEHANINLDDEEEELIPCEKDPNELKDDYQICLVGKALTECVVHFPFLKRTLANLWHPLGAVTITNIGEKRVLDGIPWSFNRHLIIFHRLIIGEDSLKVPLVYIGLWVQVHNLLFGVISEGLAWKLGNFIRQFIQHDAALVMRRERRYTHFRTKVDVQLALKCKKKLVLGQGREGFAYFQYERLTHFYYLCGKLGHGEGFCPIRMIIWTQENDGGEKEVGLIKLRGNWVRGRL